MKTLNFLVAAALISTFAFAACSKDDCEIMYDKMSKCGDKKDKEFSKKLFMALCKEMKGKEGFKDEMTCAKKSSCDDYKKCLKEKSDAKWAKKDIERIEKKLNEKKFSDALSTCKYSGKNNKLVAAKCKEVAPKACEAVVEQAKKSKAGGKKDYSACFAIKDCKDITGSDKYSKDSEEACK
ncbi:hypothetical protein KKF34_06120 [Myxococcota bacterium]|nr:hypothetical protein [Myxococcota bacterium]MBU1383202.1 hypothetical protein [Myxococcota bacterium]MBU1496436.1 hypothetical protein [Myxococcota bacterium]